MSLEHTRWPVTVISGMTRWPHTHIDIVIESKHLLIILFLRYSIQYMRIGHARRPVTGMHDGHTHIDIVVESKHLLIILYLALFYSIYGCWSRPPARDRHARQMSYNITYKFIYIAQNGSVFVNQKSMQLRFFMS